MPALKLGKNMDSFTAQRHLNRATQDLSKTFQRLSSGLRINSAADDAAGLAISGKLKGNIRVYSQALRNANDAISTLNVADGALNQLDSITNRLGELANSAANGSYSLNQRISLDEEAKALTDEFNRIVNSTKFNKRTVLDQSMSDVRIQLGYGLNESISIALAEKLKRTANTELDFTSSTTATGAISFAKSGDFNGDGRDDIVIAQSLGGISVRLGQSDGTFGAATIYNSGTSPTAVEVADLNGDGRLDIISQTTSTTRYYIGNGDGTFAAATSLTSAASGTGVVAADINGDGAKDIVVRETGALRVFLNQGNGTFDGGSSYTRSVGTATTAMVAGDFNGDGRDDIATLGGTTLYTLLGQANGSLSTEQSYTSGGSVVGGLATGDLDHDGSLDLVVAIGAVTTNSVKIFNGVGDGSFSAGNTHSMNSSSQIAVADVSGDGNLDIIGNQGSLLKNDGSGGFSSVTYNGSPNVAHNRISTGDYNGDGMIDILLPSTSSGTLTGFIADTDYTTEIQRLNLTTQDEALASIDIVQELKNRLILERGAIGSSLSRLNSSLRTLGAIYENYSAAHSRITDVDVADETAKMIAAEIRQSAASAIIAQANQTPALVLQLLTA